MRVLIRAHSGMPVPFLWKDGRPFPTSGSREVEVVKDTPPKITKMVDNPSGGKHKVVVSDPDVMGQDEYDRLSKDGRFSVVEAGGVDASLSNARVQSALAEVAKRDGVIANLNVTLGEKNAEIEKLQGMLDALGGAAKAEEAAKAAAAQAAADADKAAKGKGKASA